MGPTVHEFMVGRADAVVADASGTPEIADISMMQACAERHDRWVPRARPGITRRSSVP